MTALTGSRAISLTAVVVFVLLIVAMSASMFAELRTSPILLLTLAMPLLVLTWFDFRYQRLPFWLTLPLMAFGLVLSHFGVLVPFGDSMLGALIGTLFFVFVSLAALAVLKREGLGLGDAPLLGVGGAWFGWYGLPTILLVSTFSGLLTVLIFRRVTNASSDTEPIAFGPHLVMGIWFVACIGSLN